jgi:hypothetical protein
VVVVNWLITHWWALLLLAVLGVAAGNALLHRRRQRARCEEARAQGLRYALDQLDALHHSAGGPGPPRTPPSSASPTPSGRPCDARERAPW